MEAKTTDQLWGGETTKAVENFQISDHPIPAPVIHWLGRIKAAAARTNAQLGKLDEDLAERIANAGDEVAAGEHDDQFPIDVFQTGSGTSSNMNATSRRWARSTPTCCPHSTSFAPRSSARRMSSPAWSRPDAPT